jgi:uncharacterized LabA/DUF88 family protein
MDRCAILVDAGYLLGAAATLIVGQPDRRQLEVDHERLARLLIEEAESQSGLPVLRMLWYDGAFNSQPSSEHRSLRVLPDVKVRLGELVKREGRIVQKGVDSFLQRDLTTLARNGSVADVVLVGGDEDLRRALEEAQDYGVRVHLWGVETPAPEYNQSASLVAEADRRHVLDKAWLMRSMTARVEDTASDHQPEARPNSPTPPTAPESPQVPTEPTTPPKELATNEDLKRLAASFAADTGPADDQKGGWSVQSADHDVLPRLREITTSAQASRDNEEDATTPGRTPFDLGSVFAARWISRASWQQIATLVEVEPRAPNYLDGELLRFAERQGIETWENETAKHEIRRGFWKGVRDAVDHLTQASGQELS